MNTLVIKQEGMPQGSEPADHGRLQRIISFSEIRSLHPGGFGRIEGQLLLLSVSQDLTAISNGITVKPLSCKA